MRDPSCERKYRKRKDKIRNYRSNIALVSSKYVRMSKTLHVILKWVCPLCILIWTMSEWPTSVVREGLWLICLPVLADPPLHSVGWGKQGD